jgi:hypothetical protein
MSDGAGQRKQNMKPLWHALWALSLLSGALPAQAETFYPDTAGFAPVRARFAGDRLPWMSSGVLYGDRDSRAPELCVQAFNAQGALKGEWRVATTEAKSPLPHLRRYEWSAELPWEEGDRFEVLVVPTHVATSAGEPTRWKMLPGEYQMALLDPKKLHLPKPL